MLCSVLYQTEFDNNYIVTLHFNFSDEMPLTAAEKMRRRRQKLKDEGKYEEYKEKHRETVRKCREMKKEQEQKLSKVKQKKLTEERKRLNRERVAKHRRLKKESSTKNTPFPGPSANSPPYKNKRTLGKATARIKSVLPNSQRKKSAVIKNLYETYIEPLPQSKNSRKSTSLTPETVKAVTEFYLRDDISRQAPGRKDVITVREAFGKNKMQIRHLMFSIKEAHGIFSTENGKIIGKSKFAELQPEHVLLSNKLPHNVCLCKYHENFINAINVLHKIVPHFPEYNKNLPESFVCKIQNKNAEMVTVPLARN